MWKGKGCPREKGYTNPYVMKRDEKATKVREGG